MTGVLRPADQVRWGFTDAVVVYLFAVAASAAAFSMASGLVGAGQSVAGQLAGFAGLWAGFGAGTWAVCQWRGSGSLRRDFGLEARPRDVPVGLIAGIALQLVAVPLVSWPVQQLWDTDISEPARETLNLPGSRFALAAAIIVGAPLFEELFFRGLLLRGLARRLADVGAVAASGVLFAATHFRVAQLPALFAVGVAFAVLARQYHRLGPAIAAHVAFNATAVLMVSA